MSLYKTGRRNHESHRVCRFISLIQVRAQEHTPTTGLPQRWGLRLERKLEKPPPELTWARPPEPERWETMPGHSWEQMTAHSPACKEPEQEWQHPLAQPYTRTTPPSQPTLPRFASPSWTTWVFSNSSKNTAPRGSQAPTSIKRDDSVVKWSP